MQNPDPIDPIAGEPNHSSAGVNSAGLAIVPIPDHTLLRCIGRGSYGEVWLARNLMGAYRAVKLVFRKSFDHARPFERELAGIEKFEPISRSHKSFVDILHVGRDATADCFYYVMELGDDQALGQRIEPDHYQPKTLASLLATHGRLPVKECVRIGINLADALQHLHEHGLSHRDIKPANIIFVNDTPKLADIGLVTGIGAGQSYVGTEGFVPPEGPGTPQADIFSLGMVLYELSTGQDRRDFPTLPEDFSAFPDAEEFTELNEVILRACQGDVRRRYSTAQTLLADLMVLQNGQSVQRLRTLERRWRIAKKAAIVSGIILLALLVVLYPMILRAKMARDQRERQIGGKVSAGLGALGQGHMTEALADFTAALWLTQGLRNQEPNQRFRCTTVLAFCPKLTHVEFLEAKSKWVEFSGDGRFLLPTIWQGKAQLWDLERNAFAGPEFKIEQGLEMAALSPDGRLAVAAGMQQTACLWETATGRQLHTWLHPGKVFAAAFNHDGTRVVTACGDRKARVWDCASGELRAELAAHQDAVLAARFSRDGRWIVTAGRDRTARIWEADTGQSTGVVLEHPSWVYAAAFSPDGKRVVTAGFDRKARIWEAATGRFLPPALNHGDAVPSAEFSPDGRLLVTASMDGTARLWDAGTQLPCAVNSVLRHSSRVLHAAFAPDGHRIATTCNDGTLRIWDLAANGLMPEKIRDGFSPDGARQVTVSNEWLYLSAATERSQPLRLPAGGGLATTTFSADGQWLLTVVTGRASRLKMQLWNAASGGPVMAPIPLPWVPASVAIAPGAQMVAACGNTNAHLWDVSSGRLRPLALSPGATINALRFSPDGRQIMVQAERRLWLYDTGTGRILAGPLEHPMRITHAEFSPSGDRLVAGCADDQINEAAAQVWSSGSGQAIGKPLRHDDGVLWAAFSPDGRRVITASEDFTARIWDAETGLPLLPPLRHENQVQSAGFSPDGRWVITASTDQTARIWDASNGEPLTPPLRHPSPLWHARLLADGRRLVSGINSERAWLWQLSVDERPVEDLSTLASLLTGQLPEGDVRVNRDQLAAGRRIKSLWQAMKAKYPATFVTRRDELVYWHLTQADRAEADRQWLAAVLHLQHLTGLCPTNRLFAERQAQAEAKLRTATVPTGD